MCEWNRETPHLVTSYTCSYSTPEVIYRSGFDFKINNNNKTGIVCRTITIIPWLRGCFMFITVLSSIGSQHKPGKGREGKRMTISKSLLRPLVIIRFRYKVWLRGGTTTARDNGGHDVNKLCHSMNQLSLIVQLRRGGRGSWKETK